MGVVEKSVLGVANRGSRWYVKHIQNTSTVMRAWLKGNDGQMGDGDEQQIVKTTDRHNGNTL